MTTSTVFSTNTRCSGEGVRAGRPTGLAACLALAALVAAPATATGDGGSFARSQSSSVLASGSDVGYELAQRSVAKTGGDIPESQRDGEKSGERKKFERHVARGTEYFKTEQYRKALKHFRKARELVEHPRMSLRIGRTLEKLHECDAAGVAYQRYLSYDQIGEEGRKLGQKRIEGLKSCQPLGELSVECSPAGAEVSVEGETKECPATFELPAGEYTIAAVAPEHESRETTAEVRPEETSRVSVELEPASRAQADAGEQEAEPSQQTRPATTEPTWSKIARWGGIGAGSALIAGGVISDMTSANRVESLKQARQRGNSSRIDSLLQKEKAARTRTIILYAAGGALLAGGVSFLFVHPERQKTGGGGARAGIRLGLGSVGAQISW